MATIIRNDESFVERDEVLFPDTHLIDVEPHYNNFTAIQNALRHRDDRKQSKTNSHQRSQSTDDKHRAVRVHVEPSSSFASTRHYRSSEMLDMHSNMQKTVNPRLNIRTNPFRSSDGHIFNLTRIMQEIGYDEMSPIMYSQRNEEKNRITTKNVSALLNIVLSMGGARGPLVNIWRSRINDGFFEKWYLEKQQQQRSASMIQQRDKINHDDQRTTQKPNQQQYQSNFVIDHLAYPGSKVQTMAMSAEEKRLQNEIHQIYGIDESDTISSVSSRSSSIDQKQNEIFPTDNNNASMSHRSDGYTLSTMKSTFQPKQQQITIREHFPSKAPMASIVDRSASQYSNDETDSIRSQYQQVLASHPELYHDPNPEIIIKPNPEQVTYQQNVAVRYLVPPTPPPPGPLIIREILPPRPPTPPPLVIKYREPPPLTPSPLILREAPPTPPPHQEPTVITRMLPPQPESPQRVIVEQSPPLPPKPQSIIIEKWLPYKPAPPRQVIYERVTENPSIAQFEPGAPTVERQRRHSAEFLSTSSRVPIPVTIHRRNSIDQLQQENNTSTIEQSSSMASQHHNHMAWNTHQQLASFQQQALQQLHAHQQWAANQWQQAAMYMQVPSTNFAYQFTTPSLVVNHPPVTTVSYERRHEMRQQVHYAPTLFHPFITFT